MNLKRAIEILDGGGWCAIRFITADVHKGSGGKVLEFAKARICRNRANSTFIKATPEFAINPNHNFHFTRNIELPNKQIRKVHPILITHINQEEVV